MVPVTPSPQSRRLAATFGILGIILGLSLLVASLASFVETWPVLVQALFYLAMGIGWVFLARPLVRWAQTGRWDRPDPGAD